MRAAREVISLRVLESGALGHTKYLSGLSETCETKNPHPAPAYDGGRRDTPLRPIDTLYAIDSFEERVPAEKLLQSFDHISAGGVAPTRHGASTCIRYESSATGSDQVALAISLPLTSNSS